VLQNLAETTPDKVLQLACRDVPGSATLLRDKRAPLSLARAHVVVVPGPQMTASAGPVPQRRVVHLPRSPRSFSYSRPILKDKQGPTTHQPRAPDQGSLPVPDAASRQTTRAVFAAVLMFLAVWVIHSYVIALLWAVVIAIAIWPLYSRLAARMPQRQDWLLPLVATVLIAIMLVVPVLLGLAEIGREGQAILDWTAQAQQSGIQVPDWVARLPLLGEHIDRWWRTHLSDPSAIADLFGGFERDTLAAWTRSLGGAFTYRLLLALITFMALFLLLRSGAAIGEGFLVLSERWLGSPGERLFEKMVVAVRGVVNGTVIVAIGEGFLIGIGYVLAEVPHAILFALLTTAFAMIPLGAWFAFTGAALVLVLNGGGTAAAAGVFGWGALVMLIGDYFVQPALIGGAARLPFVWALVGILGGLETIGLVGLFLGPVLMAALLTIWREWTGSRE
jgi:predicted PurR-regulated permease PerM